MLWTQLQKYYHTLKYLNLKQILWLSRYRLYRQKARFSSLPALRLPKKPWQKSISKASQPFFPQSLIFLNQQHTLESSIWFDATLDKLWRYNLHYFDVLHAPDIDLVECHKLMHRWIAENPAQKGCGWEPYPLSLRIVNWIKYFLAGNQPTTATLKSLTLQIQVLTKNIETHILANHVLANAKALLFAGIFFQKEAWFRQGYKLFQKEWQEQILADGAHFELSPMYHAIILEDILDIVNLFQMYDYPIPADWIHKIEKMFHWLENLCHADGKIAFFNDAAFNIAPTLAELENYRIRLLPPRTSRVKAYLRFPQSGYCRMQRNNILVLADTSPIGASYQPGHAHADTLSFELSFGTQRVFVNSGTSCYENIPARWHQRSTKAHNTVVIDDKDSSHVWKSFRVAQRAKVTDVNLEKNDNYFYLRATHDGYKKIFHTRSWKLSDDKLIIKDIIKGGVRTNTKIELFFHLHPQICAKKNADQKIYLLNDDKKLLATVEMSIQADIAAGNYHPEFNVSIPNQHIIATVIQTLPVKIVTVITFIEGHS